LQFYRQFAICTIPYKTIVKSEVNSCRYTAWL